MIVKCPNCGRDQRSEEIFCSHCGTRLAAESGGTPTMAFQGSNQPSAATTQLAQNPPKPGDAARLNLHIIRTGEVMPIGGDGEYVVGRVSRGQSVLPDVDLQPFHAYEAGVSRLHVRIRVDDKGMSITDLGSANGTTVNNERLLPNEERALEDKDVVRLGRFSFQVLVADV